MSNTILMYLHICHHIHVSQYRLPDDQSVVTACDNGKLEVWRCQGPGMTELGETGIDLQSHDDMALSIALLAGGEKVVSAGADKK